MWFVTRQKDSATAEAAVVATTTLDALADFVGLEGKAAKRWASPCGALPAEPLPSGTTVRIPNTVLMVWVGDVGRLGRLAVGWTSEREHLESLGFRVRELVFDAGGAREAGEILAAIHETSQAGHLHGLYVVGHGDPAGFGRKDAELWVYHDEVLAALSYRLGLVILNCCNGGWSITDEGAEGLGGRDLVASSPGARFHGIKTYLWPRIFLFPGHAKRVSDLLCRGEQGTV